MTNIILISFVLLTIFSDIRYRKVFNSAVLSAIIIGFGMNILSFGIEGLKTSSLGLIAGFCFLFVFYILGGIGAGDIKFMAAVGAIKGASFVVISVLYGALIGGIAALIMLALKRKLIYTLLKVVNALKDFITTRKKESLSFDESDSFYIPYAVFLSLGVLLNLFFSSPPFLSTVH